LKFSVNSAMGFRRAGVIVWVSVVMTAACLVAGLPMASAQAVTPLAGASASSTASPSPTPTFAPKTVQPARVALYVVGAVLLYAAYRAVYNVSQPVKAYPLGTQALHRGAALQFHFGLGAKH